MEDKFRREVESLKSRQKWNWGIFVSSFIAIVAVFLGIIAGYSGEEGDGPLTVFLTLVLLACAFAGRELFHRTEKKLQKEFREIVMRYVAPAMFDSYEFLPEIGFLKETVSTRKLLDDSWDEFESFELLRGKCKGVPFRRAKIRYGDFHGLWMEFTCSDEHFDGARIITSDFTDAKKPTASVYNDPLTRYKSSSAGSFNEEFLCYCKDDLTAQIILGKDTMAKLRSIKKKIVNPFLISYYEDRMIVIIRTYPVDMDIPCEPSEQKDELERAWTALRPVGIFTRFLLRDYSIMTDMVDDELDDYRTVIEGGRK